MEVSTWKNSKLLTASFTNYDYSTNPSGKIYPVKTQQVNLSSPSATFTFASTSANNISVTKDSRYEDESTIKFLGGNLSEVKPKSGVTQAYIWDYNNNLPIAKVLNASGLEFAFTSFEADGKGNWTFTGIPATDLTAPTGTKSYTLGSNITKSGLSTSTTYIVSYWKKSGSVAVNATAAVAGRTINGWTYYEHKVVNPSSGLITVSGTNGIIDELRLYPVSAQMTTYTYEPLVGLKSQCDASNMIIYYEYDTFNRLKAIRDQDGNILKTFEYKYQESQTQQ